MRYGVAANTTLPLFSCLSFLSTALIVCSDLETTRLPASTCLLELAALAAHMWRRGAVWHTGCLAKVTLSLPCFHRAAQQDGALAEGCPHGESIEGEALPASFHNASASGLSETCGADDQLWNIEQALVIGNCANHCCNLVILCRHSL